MAGLVDIVMPNGVPGTVPAEQLSAALAAGAIVNKQGGGEDDGGLLGGLAAGILGAGSSATLGMSDRLLKDGSYVLGGKSFEKDVTSNLKAVRERNPLATMAGEFGGLLLAPEALAGVGEAAEGAVAARAGEGLLANMAKGSARFAAESAVLGAQHQVTEDALGDHEYNGEAVFAAAAKDALIGAPVGAAFGGLGYGLRAAGRGAAGLFRGRPGPASNAVLDEIAGGIEGAGRPIRDHARDTESFVEGMRQTGATAEQAAKVADDIAVAAKARVGTRAEETDLVDAGLNRFAREHGGDREALIKQRYADILKPLEDATNSTDRSALEMSKALTGVLRNTRDTADVAQFGHKPEHMRKLWDPSLADAQRDAINSMLQETDRVLLEWESTASKGGAEGDLRKVRNLWLDAKESMAGKRVTIGGDVPFINPDAGLEGGFGTSKPLAIGAEEGRPIYLRPQGRVGKLATESPIGFDAPAPDSFVDVVKQVGAETTDRFGRYKVFISDLSEGVRSRFPGMSEAEFRSALVQSHLDGQIRLSRADLVAAMSKSRVAASETAHLNAQFHFLDLEGVAPRATPKGRVTIDPDAGLRGSSAAKDAFRLSSAETLPRRIDLAADTLDAAASRSRPIKVTPITKQVIADAQPKADALKRALDKYAKWGKAPGSLVDKSLDAVRYGLPEATQDLGTLANSWRSMLEDTSVWGRQGAAQAELNHAFSDMKPRGDHLLDQLGVEIEQQRGVRIPEGDFARTKAMLEKITGNPEVDDALQPIISARRAIDGFRERDRVARKWLDLSPEEIAKLDKGLAELDTFERTLASAREEAAIANRLKAAVLQEGGPAVPGILGMVTDAVTRPLATAERLAHLSETVGRVKRGVKKVLRAFTDSTEIGTSKASSAAETAPRAREKIISDIEDVKVVTSNPAALEERAARLVGDLGNYAPKIANEVRLAAIRALLYLAQEAPKPSASSSGAFEKPKLRYSDIQIHDWETKRTAALDPESVVRDLRRGTLNRDAIKAAEVAAPKLFAMIQSETRDELDRLEAAGLLDKMPYQQKAVLATLLKVPSDATWTNEFISMMQASKSAPPAPSADASKPAGAMPRKSNQKPVADLYQTASQGIEAGGNV